MKLQCSHIESPLTRNSLVSIVTTPHTLTAYNNELPCSEVTTHSCTTRAGRQHLPTRPVAMSHSTVSVWKMMNQQILLKQSFSLSIIHRVALHLFPLCATSRCTASSGRVSPLVLALSEGNWPILIFKCLFKAGFNWRSVITPPPHQDSNNILQSRSVHHRSGPGTAERGSPCCPSSRRLYRTKPELWLTASSGTSCTWGS